MSDNGGHLDTRFLFQAAVLSFMESLLDHPLNPTPATIIEQSKYVVVAIVRIMEHETHRACVEYIELIDAAILPEWSTRFFIGEVSSDPKVTNLRIL